MACLSRVGKFSPLVLVLRSKASKRYVGNGNLPFLCNPSARVQTPSAPSWEVFIFEVRGDHPKLHA